MEWLRKAEEKQIQCPSCLNYQFDEHTKQHVCIDTPDGLSSDQATMKYFTVLPQCPNFRDT